MTCVISVVQNAFETISINSDYYPVKTDVKKKKKFNQWEFLVFNKNSFLYEFQYLCDPKRGYVKEIQCCQVYYRYLNIYNSFTERIIYSFLTTPLII